MNLTTQAIVCAILGHGENGAVVRFLTEEAGLVAGYVRGGRSRRLRPMLQPGNLVQVELRSRLDDQLAAATIELLSSRAPLTLDALPAAGLDWVTSLTAAALAEGQIYPGIHAALSGLLTVMDHSDDPRLWAAAVARYELLLLERLGFGLDLSECAATGLRTDLVFVSPKSSKAVSRDAGLPYADRLLPLPAFLRGDAGPSDWLEIAAALLTTGHFVERRLLAHRRGEDLLRTRQRFTQRVAKRAGTPYSPEL